jgi:dihydrodipicolinate synthase/N-acetylneuraminate lyase
MIIVLAVGTAVLKLLGPLLLGGRSLPVTAMAIIELLAAALLAALVVVETFGNGRSLTLDARALGVGFAAIALSRRAPVIVAVTGAAVVTAIARALA